MKLSQWPATPHAIPPLESLRVFFAVAECGGFRQAGLELNLTPGAIAHQIKKLEQWLGFPLFRRLPRGVELTPAGQRYARTVGQLLREIASATDGLRQEVTSNVLTISAMPSLVTRWLLPRLPKLKEAGLDHEVRVLATPELTDFSRDQVDVAIREGPGGYGGLTEEKILSEFWAPVCSPIYRSGRSLQSAEDLLSATLLHDEPWPGTPRQILWPDWLGEAGCFHRDAERNLRFSHTYLTIEAALAGQGIALANIALVADELETGRLVAPLGAWLKGPYDFHLVAPQENRHRPAVAAFWSWMAAEAATQEVLVERLTAAGRD